MKPSNDIDMYSLIGALMPVPTLRARRAHLSKPLRWLSMRMLHVADLRRSLEFYSAVGYTVVGSVEGTPFGTLTMLRLPDDPFVSLELVHDPGKGAVELGNGINHLVVQVASLRDAVAELGRHGIVADASGLHDDANAPQTAWLTDPDGYRIELVQWPAGHAAGMTEADFAAP
jgi:lactoylglutathione lyase